MKNSIFYAFKALFVLCIALTFLTASAFSPGQTKDNGYAKYKVEKTVKADVSAFAFVSVADMPETSAGNLEVHFSYLQPVNDPKPDNTNYQLIRKESLKLHKAIRDC